MLSWQNTWINLTNNPISPVCNNESKYKYSIWVYAIDEEWYKTTWTNYWSCADFWAPWVWIISTSIPVYNSNYWNNYNMSNWTSFSAPIISWIIALWYNQYWYIKPVDVYDALGESKIKDDKVWYKIDASKYIDILWKKVEENKKAEEQKVVEQQNKQKAEIAFNSIKNKVSKQSKVKQENIYNWLLKQLDWFNWRLKWDKLIILNHLIYLINKELWIAEENNLWDLFWNLFPEN